MTTTKLQAGVTALLPALADRAHHATPDQAALIYQTMSQLLDAQDALDPGAEV